MDTNEIEDAIAQCEMSATKCFTLMQEKIDSQKAYIQALKLEYEPETLTEGDFIEYEAHQVNVSLCSKEELKQAKLQLIREIRTLKSISKDLNAFEERLLYLKQKIEDE